MEIFVQLIESLAVIVCAVAGYFFLVTRGSLIIESLRSGRSSSSHIYWIYKNRFLIRLTDRQIIISAILLFNYRRLVDEVVSSLNPSLKGKSVLQASCAFGDISVKIARRCAAQGAKRLVISDLVDNEIRHARAKCERAGVDKSLYFARENVLSMAHRDGTFDYVVIFFLFHELPLPLKSAALKEAARVLKPGGSIIFGEFHRPGPWLLRASGRVFFKVFEPYAVEMWDFDPVSVLTNGTLCGWEFSKKTYFGSNYQVFTARKTS